MNPRWSGILAVLLMLSASGPAGAYDLLVEDIYRTDGYIHRLEVSDGYVAWIESPEDVIGGGDVEPSPLDLYISNGEQVTRISSDRMRPALPAQIATQLGAVAWYGQGPDLPTGDVYAILYQGGVNTVLRKAAPAGGLPIGNQELKSAIELPMVVFGALQLIEGGYYQHMFLWQNGSLAPLSLVEYPRVNNYCPAIDSRRVVWGVEVLPETGDERQYLLSLWEGGVLVDLTASTEHPVANVQADGRLIVWSQTDSRPWQVDDKTSEVFMWDENGTYNLSYVPGATYFDGKPHLNRRQIAWRTEHPFDHEDGPAVLINTFTEGGVVFDMCMAEAWPGFVGDPVISEDFLAYCYKYWEPLDPLATSTEMCIAGYHTTATHYDEYMPRADFPHVVWVRDEGASRVLVFGQPDAQVDLELELNLTFFHPGDPFLLETSVTTNVAPLISDMYVVLEVAGQFFFWPSWTGTPAGRMTILEGTEPLRETILEFTWPDVDETVLGLHFHGALVWHATYVLLDYDMVTFGFGP